MQVGEAPLGSGGPRRPHLVQFYESDESLSSAVAEFLTPALSRAAPAVVIATAAHRVVIEARLADAGIDLERERQQRRYLALDAQETLQAVMVGETPDVARFREAVGRPIAELLADRSPGCTLRAYGEMVDVLWKEGKTLAAIQLEELWNALQEQHAVSLLCAYSFAGFYNETAESRRVCGAHTEVRRPERPEEVRRREIDTSLRSSLRELSTVAQQERRFHRIIGAIADAVTAEQVFEAVVEETAAALEASSAGLWLADEDTRVARLVRSVGYSEQARRAMEQPSLDATGVMPAIDALASGEPIWLSSQNELLDKYPHLAAIVTPSRQYAIACLPIRVGDRRLGVLGLTFDDAAIQPDGRQLLLIVSRYCAQALERLRLLEAERASRARAEASAARMALLSRASHAFAEAGPSFERVVQAVVHEIVPAYADACGVVLARDHDDELDVVAVEHRDPEAVAGVRALLELRRHRRGEGLTGRVAETGEAIFLPTVDRAALLAQVPPDYRAWVEQHCPHSIIAVPMRARGRVLGVLGANRQAPSPPFTAEDFELLTEVGDRAAMALDASRLLRETETARGRAELLYQLSRAVMSAQTVDDVYRAALDAIAQGLEVPRAAVLLSDAAGTMRFVAWRELSEDYRRAVEGHSPWAPDAVGPQPVVVSDAQAEPSLSAYRDLFRREGIGALAFIPLTAAGRLIGKFMLYERAPRSFSAPELDLASAIGDHVALAVVRFRAVEELQRAVRFHELFTGMLGHDLRTPLTAILTSAQLALSRVESDRLVKPLSRIIGSSQRMARMIEQLLDFTRMRLGQGIPLDLRRVDIAAVARQVIEEIDEASPDWTFRLAQTGDTSGSWDQDRLSQVFSNLIANAVQHGAPSGGVDVHVDGSPESVAIVIRNQGAIPVELLPTLFEPLSGRERRIERSRGLGLGLHITREIVRAHQGTISVESTPERGTTFRIVLPR